MARRNDHSREQIHAMALEAARDLVREQGTNALSARKVATAIGYTPGSLYLVFQNLDDLIAQLNLRTLNELHASLGECLQTQETTSPRQQLLSIAFCYTEFAHNERPLWELLYSHSWGEDQAAPDGYEALINELFSMLESRLLAIAPQRDAAVSARALWGAIHGITQLDISGKLDLAGPCTTTELAKQLVHTFLDGYGLTNEDHEHKDKERLI